MTAGDSGPQETRAAPTRNREIVVCRNDLDLSLLSREQARKKRKKRGALALVSGRVQVQPACRLLTRLSSTVPWRTEDD